MPVTLIVEPDNDGHRFHAVGNVARLAGATDRVVLLTSRGAGSSAEFDAYLRDLPITVIERFEQVYPPTSEMARAVREQCETGEVTRVAVMDADQSLKRWWYVAAREFRGLPHRPQVIFMLTRYPARVRATDRFGWALRISKGTLALLARATGTVHRVVGFAGRDDTARGWIVKRVRDPATCTAHSRDRAALRDELGLPAERRIVGVFGVITDRKHVPLTLDAARAAGDDVDVLLGGPVRDDVVAWLAGLPPELRRRVLVRDGYLPNPLLDALVAACDVVMIAMTNNGPSGIMGKALAAGVPVVTAGSSVRAREVRATHGGLACDLAPGPVIETLRALLTHGMPPGSSSVPPATDETFAATLLGVAVPTPAP